jgi:HAD superfamily hydrolase (TIGR01509 family)
VNHVTVAGLTGVRGAIFDFNGTITDDEELQYDIYREVFADLYDVVLDRATYYTDLAGLSDPGIVAKVAAMFDLRLSDAEVEALLAERVVRYADRVAGDPPVRPGAAALIRELSERVPIALGTGAYRSEAEMILSAAGLIDCFTALVTVEDVANGKPDPETFQRALASLQGLEPHEVVVFEDSIFGVAAAQAAGMRCVAVPVTTDGIALAAGGSTEVVVVDSLHPGLLNPHDRPASRDHKEAR